VKINGTPFDIYLFFGQTAMKDGEGGQMMILKLNIVTARPKVTILFICCCCICRVTVLQYYSMYLVLITSTNKKKQTTGRVAKIFSGN
jgi:hypothetical protein